MFKFLELKNNKKIYLVFLIGIMIATSYGFFNLDKFDKIEEPNGHIMIRGDLGLIWHEAETFKEDFLLKKNIFGNGIEYTRTFLPPKIVAFYHILTNQDLYDDNDNRIVKTGGKKLYLFFQILFYYLSLLYLYKKLIPFYSDKNLAFYIISYLALDPNIIQWHGTFWTESVFLSLQILLIGLIIKKHKSNLFCLCLGLFLGVIFLQKTVAVLFILFIIFYIFFSEEKKNILKVFNIILGFFIILSLLGYDNYKKTGIFYVMPMQTKDAHYVYLIPQIFDKNNQLISMSNLKEEEKEWKKINNWSKDNFKTEYIFKKYQQKKALEVMLNNKITAIQIYLKNTIIHTIINPLQTFYWHKYNQKKYSKTEFHLSEESHKYFIYKIFHSTLFYIVIFMGILEIIKNNDKFKFHLLISFLILYLMFMLGWVGNSRYFMPSIIFLSIFFGHGFNFFINLINKKNL